MRIDEKLKAALAQIAADLGVSDVVIELEESADPKFGDYASNLAIKLFHAIARKGTHLPDYQNKTYVALTGKKWQPGSPVITVQQVGDYVAKELEGKLAGISVSFLAPVFVNITLTPILIWQAVIDVLAKGDAAGYNELRAGKIVLVEHSSPNLFKPFHIGHMMNNAVGESLSRLALSSGAKTVSLSYPSDVSLGIGKAVWSLLQSGAEKLLDGSLSEVEKLKKLGDAYVGGTRAYEESEEVQAEIRAITQSIYAGEDGNAWQVYQIGRDLSLSYFKTITARLGSQFDQLFFESEAGIVGKKIVEEFLEKGVFEKSDGAVIYDGEKEGLHTRVFISSEGNPTYEAKDIGLMSIKNSTYQPDTSITVTDHQQSAYFKVVASAAGKINPLWEKNFKHVPHGRMQFKGKKMSSRLGGVPMAEEIIDAVRSEVIERSGEKKLSEEAVDAIAIGAVKFVILRAEAGKNINFDPETSLSFEGDSGPYLQYTYARIQSLLAKANENNITPEVSLEKEISLVGRKLLHFEETVEKAQQNHAPHYIVSYLLGLAREFNSWYANTPILTGEDPVHSLAKAKAVGQVIKNGLHLLGIDAPEKM